MTHGFALVGAGGVLAGTPAVTESRQCWLRVGIPVLNIICIVLCSTDNSLQCTISPHYYYDLFLCVCLKVQIECSFFDLGKSS